MALSSEKDAMSRPTVREYGVLDGGGGMFAAERAMSSCVADIRGCVLLSLEVSNDAFDLAPAGQGFWRDPRSVQNALPAVLPGTGGERGVGGGNEWRTGVILGDGDW